MIRDFERLGLSPVALAGRQAEIVVETQLCGRPVIHANTRSLPEFAGDGALKFKPDDIAGVGNAAMEVINDDVVSEQLVARGYENAGRFFQDDWIASHMSLYAGLGITCRDCSLDNDEGSMACS